jgi:hypothetical protein
VFQWQDLQQSTGDTAELNHRGNSTLDTSELILFKVVDTDRLLEGVRVKDTRDKTLIDTSGSTHETKREDSEP